MWVSETPSLEMTFIQESLILNFTQSHPMVAISVPCNLLFLVFSRHSRPCHQDLGPSSAAVIWAIWTECNKQIFQDKAISHFQINAEIKAALLAWGSALKTNLLTGLVHFLLGKYVALRNWTALTFSRGPRKTWRKRGPCPVFSLRLLYLIAGMLCLSYLCKLHPWQYFWCH